MRRWWQNGGKMLVGALASVIFIGTGLGCFMVIIKQERREEIEHPLVITIDKCEYIVVPGGMFSDRTYTHKEDCKNPIHAKSK